MIISRALPAAPAGDAAERAWTSGARSGQIGIVTGNFARDRSRANRSLRLRDMRRLSVLGRRGGRDDWRAVGRSLADRAVIAASEWVSTRRCCPGGRVGQGRVMRCQRQEESDAHTQGLDLAVADRVTTVGTGLLAGARAGGQRIARRMMKSERVWSLGETLTLVVVGRSAPSARGGMCCRWGSQRDLVRASLLLVPERPKTPAG